MKKVVIIGAGPAGLTAAYELLKKSNEYEVIILEASNSIGGISRTVKYNGNRMDIGGHRFFSKNEEILAIWKEILPLQGVGAYDDKKLNRNFNDTNTNVDPDKTDKVLLIRNRVSRIFYLDKFFDYPVTLKFSTLKNLGLFKTISCGFSYLKSLIHKKKETSLENFYINRFGKKMYSMFFEGYTEKLWGRHPKDISSDWGSQRVKGLSIIEILRDMFCKTFKIKSVNTETSLIESFYYPKFGPGQLWESMAAKVEKMGGKIYKNSLVINIDYKYNKINSVKYQVNDKIESIDADILISSMPIKDLVQSMGKKVPKEVQQIALNLPYRDFVTIGLLVDRLKLKNTTSIKTLNNIIPDCWIYVQDTSVKLGRIQVFNNWSPYMVKDPDNTVWIGLEYFCNEGDDFWQMTDKELCKIAVNELVKMKIIDRRSVLDYHCEKVKKAYPAYFDSYNDISKVIRYLNKISNLYCIGRNGQHRYNNMDHSMETAILCVDNIINNISDKSNIWNVNSDDSYHEKR